MGQEKTRKNCGSAVIEITILMPVILGCIYFYIMLFLFFVETGKEMGQLAVRIYETETGKQQEISQDNILVRKEGNVKVGRLEERGNLFTIRLELRKDESDPVENIRRWQLVSGKF